MFRRTLQNKLVEKKLPFRQAVMESLGCFDDATLDYVDDYDPADIDKYCVEM